jgi:hypothetical protein
MRRMMHSLFLIVFFGAPAFAQQTTSSLLYSDIRSKQTGNTANDVGSTPTAGAASSEMSAPTVESGYGSSLFSQSACNMPYSQLGVKMSCSDASPNLWCVYAAERAALAAKIMKHVDMQCGCSATGGCSKLHTAPCESGCGESGCGEKDRGCTTKAAKINRYKEPFSSLYADPCVQCSTGKCKLGHRLHGAMPTTGCNTCVPNTVPVYPSQHQSHGCASIPSPAASMAAPDNSALANRQVMLPNPINLTR